MSLLDHPNPALNEEEVALLIHQPEECLRRAVQRGAISLDQVTEELAPHVAAACAASSPENGFPNFPPRDPFLICPKI
jgi:hypothetical protein